MDRTTAKAIRTKLNAIFEEHGIDGYELELGNATYNSVEVTFKAQRLTQLFADGILYEPKF
tara:strand:- start:337 stop:519 length:183 start_codon:yes stop_codon:yes gene_type:complete